MVTLYFPFKFLCTFLFNSHIILTLPFLPVFLPIASTFSLYRGCSVTTLFHLKYSKFVYSVYFSKLLISTHVPLHQMRFQQIVPNDWMSIFSMMLLQWHSHFGAYEIPEYILFYINLKITTIVFSILQIRKLRNRV